MVTVEGSSPEEKNLLFPSSENKSHHLSEEEEGKLPPYLRRHKNKTAYEGPGKYISKLEEDIINSLLPFFHKLEAAARDLNSGNKGEFYRFVYKKEIHAELTAFKRDVAALFIEARDKIDRQREAFFLMFRISQLEIMRQLKQQKNLMTVNLG